MNPAHRHTQTHQAARPAPPRTGRRTPAGLTLMEMLVAVSVMAIMILVVGQILVQTQRFISAAQRSRRSHAMAFTVARIIRRDIRRISKNGFLYISSSGDKMIFSTAGPVSGISDPIRGDGSVIAYGVQEYTNSATDETQKYLWRPEFICSSDGDPSASIDGERLDADFSSVQQAGPTADANSNFGVNDLVSIVESSAPSGLELPPTDAANLNKLWQVLLPSVDNVKISWTNGGTSGNIPWNETGGGTWTHNNQDNWPKAVRITFDIFDPAIPKQLQKYEVICAVGQ